MAERWRAGPPARHLHLVGIGGVGMSAMAECLVALGHRVSGSDLRDGPVLDHLRTCGVEVALGHRPGLAAGADAVIRSRAVPDADPEVVVAHQRGVRVLERSEALAALTALRRTVAVSGTHGKTTTTAMTAAALDAAGMQPSWMVGARLRGRQGGGRWAAGEWLVTEADESDGTFLALDRAVAVVTNVEADHLDHWGSLDALTRGFEEFVAGAGKAVVCADDPGAMALVAAAPSVLTYGTSSRADVVVEVLGSLDVGQRLALGHRGANRVELSLAMPGVHNARNAAAAAAAALAAGATLAQAAVGLGSFAGVSRRFEVRGERRGAVVVDDYAHMPAEVAAAVGAARRWRRGSRLVCVFQPHRYSRTAALGPEFGPSFAGVDLLVVTDVYGAGEDPLPGVSGVVVADAVRDHGSVGEVVDVHTLDEAAAVLADRLRPGDTCLTLGAGDVTTLADRLEAAERDGR